MRQPKDQGLYLTIFISLWLTVTVLAWLALPVHHKVVIEGADEPTEPEETLLKLDPAVTVEERIRNLEKAIGVASATVEQADKSDKAESGAAPKKKGP